MSTSTPNPPPCCRHGDPFGFCEPSWAALAARTKLSPQEVQIARLIVAGESDKEIATALGMAKWTVRTHLTRLFKKLKPFGVKRREDVAPKLTVLHNAWLDEAPSRCPRYQVSQ